MNCYRCTSPIPDESRYCLACGAEVSGHGDHTDHLLDSDPELEAQVAEELSGEFVIERLLGRGGMAFVFLARDLQLGRRVAIKVLPPALTHGSGLIERFKREARTAATLDHPHIVPLYRISKSGKLFWFAMKYIDGESLADLLEREKCLSPERSAEILTGIADALDFAHQHGIIHRDVKPANVLIDRRGWVSVTDFGIAKAMGLESLTGTGLAVGTPYYMSPEQCSGTTPVTGASDQYSLGVLAYLMLGGCVPFAGDSPVDIIKQHWLAVPPSLDVLRPGLPAGLATVVERALAKKPNDRFASVTEFAEAFGAAVRTARAAAATAPAVERVPPGGWRGRKLIVASLGGTAALGIVGMMLWQTSTSPSRSESKPPAPDSARESSGTPRTDTTLARASPERVAGSLASPAPNSGVVVVRGLPNGARVVAAGVQRRPMFQLSAGRHVVELRAAGYEPQVATIQVRAGDTVRLRFSARPVAAKVAERPGEPALLRIEVQPPARVTINGADFGERRILIHAVAGGASHVIRVVPVRSGYASRDTTVTPQSGDTVTVRIRLKELQ